MSSVKKFKNNKSSVAVVTSAIMVVVVAAVAIYNVSVYQKILLVPFVAFVFLFVISPAITVYIINNETLIKKVYWKKEIRINEITSVSHAVVSVQGWFPRIEQNCFIIKYNKNDELRVFPKNEKEFLQSLSKLNKNIKFLKKYKRDK